MHGNVDPYGYRFSHNHGELSTEQRRHVQHSKQLPHNRQPACTTHHDHNRRMHTIHHGSAGSKLRMHLDRDRPVPKSNYPNRHSNLHRRSNMQSGREYSDSNLHWNNNRPDNRTLIHNRTLPKGTTAGIASWSVSYTPSGTTARTDMITATYVTDTSHTASSDAFSLTVTMQVQAHQTSTSISCLLNTVVINQVTPCTATVTDTSAAPTNPTGNVSFSSDSTGSFIPDTANCMLTPVGANVASCSISYVPSAMGTGTHTISATYSGDSSHVSSLGQ